MWTWMLPRSRRPSTASPEELRKSVEMLQNRIVPLLFLLLLILEGHHQSDAIPFGRIRFLVEVPPPAPSPESDITGNNRKDSTGSDKCLLSSHSCSFKTLTACLRFSGNDLKEVFLIVENTGENPIQVNVTIAPANKTSEISLTKQQVKEVNVTEKVQGSYAIILSGSSGSCEIKSSSSTLSGWTLPYTTLRLTPIYGVYILFVVSVIVGGVWGYCKFARSESHVENGSIPYQELEMAQQSDSINNDVETAQDGWGETWDDDWDDGGDEIREVKSPRKANGHASGRWSSNRGGDGWDDSWDD